MVVIAVSRPGSTRCCENRPIEPPTAFSRTLIGARRRRGACAAASAGDDPEVAMTRALELAEATAGARRRGRLRHALAVFLTHHPRALELGLRVPSLVERAPHSPGEGPRQAMTALILDETREIAGQRVLHAIVIGVSTTSTCPDPARAPLQGALGLRN